MESQSDGKITIGDMHVHIRFPVFLKLYLISFEILVSNPGSSLGQERASGVEI
jgi:hypothetical protein